MPKKAEVLNYTSTFPSYVLDQKFNALKGDMKKWNEEVYGNVGKQKKEMEAGICRYDSIEEITSCRWTS